jgi:hypothetical protein
MKAKRKTENYGNSLRIISRIVLASCGETWKLICATFGFVLIGGVVWNEWRGSCGAVPCWSLLGIVEDWLRIGGNEKECAGD